jgi:hypothetical protein
LFGCINFNLLIVVGVHLLLGEANHCLRHFEDFSKILFHFYNIGFIERFFRISGGFQMLTESGNLFAKKFKVRRNEILTLHGVIWANRGFRGKLLSLQKKITMVRIVP